MIFQPSDLIHSYTHQQAIEDGFQVCVSDQFPNDTRMFRFPVYFTAEVWKLSQGKGAIVWDICYMAALASKSQQNDSSFIQFSVIVNGAERKPDAKEDTLPCYRLSAQIGPQDIDDPAPVITIMFPDET
ncbi:DUF6573 family protein [Pleurocapsa sp. PCC 7319]|uniref:DUF6573 family protein n=1 Tax=Pleurocapsa sp. PCC 7319 TaxID=118161 RepID=UPI00034B7F04|nr:DUF6573 family protein [Pleurocapsa sp. PCC 7319]